MDPYQRQLLLQYVCILDYPHEALQSLPVAYDTTNNPLRKKFFSFISEEIAPKIKLSYGNK